MQRVASSVAASMLQHARRTGPRQKRNGEEEDYNRITVEGDDGNADFLKAAEKLARVILMRDRYKDIDKGQQEVLITDPAELERIEIKLVDGIFTFTGAKTQPVPWPQYVADVRKIFDLLEVGPWLSVACTRLTVLEETFELYTLLNADLEASVDPHRRGGGVFSQAVKVDNSVQLSTCMTAQTLIDHIAHTARERGTENVKFDSNGNAMSFQELLKDLNVTDIGNLTVEGLGLHPPQRKRFHRFDILDTELNRGGEVSAEILQLFLRSQGTVNNGRFYAELVRPLLESHEAPRDHNVIVTEYKIPVNGANYDELTRTARFINENLLMHYNNNMWVLQINRIASKRGEYDCRTNEDQIRNIFEPMFYATLYPRHQDYTAVAELLKHTGAINIVSDEAVRSMSFFTEPRPPASVPWSENPDDFYFFYYVWCNVTMLNALRTKLGLNTFQFRPTCGETTPHWDQLVVSFLLADSINQGIKLEGSWVLQYLYMFTRIGICMSPLSNNGACFPYFDNPFLRFFKRGLNVTLATDDPLHYHHNPEPLVEEYATAKKMYQLNATDMSEVARNSVLISSFPEAMKIQWLGALDWNGNDVNKSAVCDFRLQFRLDCLLREQALLNYILEQSMKTDPLVIAKFVKAPRGGANTGNLLGGTASGGGDGFSSSAKTIRAAQRLQHRDKRTPFPRIAISAPAASLEGFSDAVQALKSVLELRIQYRSQPNIHGSTAEEAVGVVGGAAIQQNNENSGAADKNNKNGKNGSADRGSSAGTGDTSRTGSAASPARRTSMGGDLAEAADGDDVFAAISDPDFDEDQWCHAMYYGVCLLSKVGTAPTWPRYVPALETFIEDVAKVRKVVVGNAQVTALAQQRLHLLEHQFGLHLAMNISRESGTKAEKELNNRDFYTAHKVDNNVQTDASMNARLLFNFFVEKARYSAHDVVAVRGTTPVTLRQLLSELDVNIERLTVDELTSLLGINEDLHRLFLATDNYMGGRYFAELTKELLDNYKLDEYTFAELRLEIRGESPQEWHQLARWFDRYGMASRQSRPLIRLPRDYRALRKRGIVSDFGEYLDNVFSPLWDVSLHPSRHTKLHHLLVNISGFDCVGDEQKVDMTLTPTAPHEWTSDLNPPYNYFLYYFWANIATLNDFRRRRNLPTFAFRPHCGEAGGVDHLIGGYLLCNSIFHGVTLANFPAFEYIFYISQVPISISPLSNTSKAVAYLDNPFPVFFHRGLNVTLSTHLPLKFHFTSEPLIEEYSLASKVWKLSANDLSEIARNSVLQSGFTVDLKEAFLGELFFLHSTLGNDVRHSRVSDIRVAFRYETYHNEVSFLESIINQPEKKAMEREKQKKAIRSPFRRRSGNGNRRNGRRRKPRGAAMFESIDEVVEVSDDDSDASSGSGSASEADNSDTKKSSKKKRDMSSDESSDDNPFGMPMETSSEDHDDENDVDEVGDEEDERPFSHSTSDDEDAEKASRRASVLGGNTTKATAQSSSSGETEEANLFRLPRAMRLMREEIPIYERVTGITVPDPDADEDEDDGPTRLQLQISEINNTTRDLKRDLLDVMAQNRLLANNIGASRTRVEAQLCEPMRVGANLVAGTGWEELLQKRQQQQQQHQDQK